MGRKNSHITGLLLVNMKIMKTPSVGIGEEGLRALRPTERIAQHLRCHSSSMLSFLLEDHSS